MTQSTATQAPRRTARLAWGALVLASFLAARPLAAFERSMSFEHLGSEQGMSQGAALAILQDQRGFLWVGTEDGLNRYDGTEIRHFFHKRDDRASLPSNWISALAEDRAGRLWIGTDSGGLVWRDAPTGEFRQPVTAAGRPLIDPQTRVRVVFIDRRQHVWVGTRDSGLFELDLASGAARVYRRDLNDAHSLSDDSVTAIQEDSAGSLWVATGTGLDRLDPVSGGFRQYGSDLRRLVGPNAPPVKVNTLLADSRDTIWAGSDVGLFRLDERGSASQRFHAQPKSEDALPGDRVSALLEDDEHRLWVGTTNGLALFDRRNATFSTFRKDPTDLESLPDDNITSLYQDASGLLWVGTRSGGIARWNPRSWQFGHMRFQEPNRNNITSFAVDSEGTTWIGSFGGGISRLSRQGAVSSPQEARSGLTPGDPNVMAMIVDSQDRIWFGTMDSGIVRLNPRTGEAHRFRADPKDPHSLPAPGVMSLMMGSGGTIWVGTYGGGLASIDSRTGATQRHPIDREGPTGLSGNRATALAEDSTGLIWIGTDGAGLNVFDPVSHRFRHFFHDPHDPSSLSSDTVYSVCADARGRVWVGTRGGGLDQVVGNPLVANSVRFENLSENDGLPNSNVYGIVPDELGRVWLSTNRGLAAYDPATRSVRTFRRSHGLQGDEFNFGAYFRGRDGTVFFGGSNGYNSFVPERLRFNTLPPRIALTEVLKANTPVSRTPENLSRLALGFRDNVLTLRFAALDFTGPKENRYQYRLDGFNDRWIDAGNVGQATYTNLNGGRYTFRVRAANSDGVWNERGLGIDLQVDPPPWQTWWARTIYGLAIAGIILAVWLWQRWRVEREAAYARRLRREVEDRTAELDERNQAMELANKQLREASITDPLTGLGNRRCLRDTMVESASARDAAPSVLMIIDLDHLKPINDQYGHDGGDAVINRIAEILRHLFRSADLIVRWGGDEFVVWCRGCDLDTASALAERVRMAVAKCIFHVGDGAVARTSCSIGFATVPFIAQAPELLDWEQSLNLADMALYRAKSERNSWLGWSGSEAAAHMPSLLVAIETDSAALEQSGVLQVRRCQHNMEDTVDHLRARSRGDGR